MSNEVALSNTALVSIADLAKAPNMTPEILREYISAQKEIIKFQAELDFNRDRAAMQAELPPVEEKHRNEHTKSWYAKIEDVNETITPTLSKHGFSVTFETETLEKVVKVTAVLIHKSGHSARNTVEMPLEREGAKGNVNKTETHAMGSALTYARRYAQDGLLNLKYWNRDNKSSSLDDDGSLGGSKFISHEHVKQILELLNDTETSAKDLCELFEVNSVPEIPLFRGGQAIMMLKAKKAGKKISDADPT